MLNPANFSANPVYGPPAPARILGSGATLSPDAVAVGTGSVDISALSSAGGTIEINGTPIAIGAGDNAAAAIAAINAQTGTTGVTASLNGSNRLVLTSADADTNVAIGGTSTLSLLGELGLNVGTTNATNLLTQNAVGAGQTMAIQVGGNPALTITFGTGAGPGLDTGRTLHRARRHYRRHRLRRHHERQCHGHRVEHDRHGHRRRHRVACGVRHADAQRAAIEWQRDRQRSAGVSGFLDRRRCGHRL